MENVETDDVKIPWEMYDYIGIAGCVQYEERYRQTKAELEEYGCKSATWRLDFPNPFKEALYRIIKKARGQQNAPSDFYLAMNHYGNLKTAYLTGAERALFMEDDVAFLKDRKLLAEIMSTVPEDADIALYDWRPRFHEKATPLFGRRRIGGHWVEANDVELLYFSMVAFSRKGMKYIIDGVENGAFKSGMYDIDAYFRPGMNKGLKTYVAFPHAAMQINTGHAVHAREKPYKGLVNEGDYFVRGDSIKASSKPARPSKRAPSLPEGEPVDAVFVIGTETYNNNEELRYALRNLEAHCKFVRDVYICGECPPWVDKSKVKHLPWPDKFTHAKDANIIDKLRHACECPGIAKYILFCSDDQFQTKECEWDDFSPRWLKKYDPSDKYYIERHRVWHTRLKKTLDRELKRRKEKGLDTKTIYYWQPHIWMPMDRDKFLAYAKWSDYENRDDTIIASGYYNFIGAEGDHDFDHIFLSSRNKSIPHETHIAYNDDCYGAAMSILLTMFPSMSKFELYGGTATKTSEPSQVSSKDVKPASGDEARIYAETTAMIRAESGMHWLLGDVAKAEEMRIYCADGWRTVWKDIIERLESGVQSQMGADAKRILDSYAANPAAMRTVKFAERPKTRPTEKVQAFDSRSVRGNIRNILRKRTSL